MSLHRPDALSGRAAIAGIGATEFSKDSGRSELKLAVEAVHAALDDAGLGPADVDGLVTFTMDTTPEITLAQAAGIGELTFFSRVHYGGGAACATIQQAALAVATGIAEVVVCYRAFNERSGRRFGSGVQERQPSAEGAALGWNLPFGLLTPASWVAMAAQRYLHTYGLTSEAFGHVAVTDRRHAARNRAAYFYGKPITLADHAASRWIAEPLRLLDCCQETDGGQALVVTTSERARDLRRPPALITAAAQGAGRAQEQMTSFYRDDLTGLPEMNVVARQLWRTSRLTPADIDVAILYDHFTPFVLMQLEEFGFCAPGEAAGFVAADALPLNTHGGQLGEAYLHGMNGIAEAVRQLRGTSPNQIPDATHVLVTAGTGVPTSGLVLSRDQAGAPPGPTAGPTDSPPAGPTADPMVDPMAGPAGSPPAGLTDSP
ncbi:thiolase C-terminal domain-containing protein [Streptomyces sp. NRRL S-1448]|uniref:thiolase C-terminal domain-containing protein n=1 Tax=Streptomyces sp. NRRL S-1448 TaxID=1463883 RepID=UPI00099C41D1|nr:lipid-transfer protein [Streptomyces sp. NRRL S-1448]